MVSIADIPEHEHHKLIDMHEDREFAEARIQSIIASAKSTEDAYLSITHWIRNPAVLFAIDVDEQNSDTWNVKILLTPSAPQPHIVVCKRSSIQLVPEGARI